MILQAQLDYSWDNNLGIVAYDTIRVHPAYGGPTKKRVTRKTTVCTGAWFDSSYRVLMKDTGGSSIARFFVG